MILKMFQQELRIRVLKIWQKISQVNDASLIHDHVLSMSNIKNYANSCVAMINIRSMYKYIPMLKITHSVHVQNIRR